MNTIKPKYNAIKACLTLPEGIKIFSCNERNTKTVIKLLNTINMKELALCLSYQGDVLDSKGYKASAKQCHEVSDLIMTGNRDVRYLNLNFTASAIINALT